jgi:hypothetical protein
MMTLNPDSGDQGDQRRDDLPTQPHNVDEPKAFVPLFKFAETFGNRSR